MKLALSIGAALLAGSASAASSYSASIGGGRGQAYINLWSTSSSGISLVAPPFQYLPDQGPAVQPVQVTTSGDLVYVAYSVVGTLPQVVELHATPTGLSYEWSQPLSTGGPDLAGSSITAVDTYLVEDTYPYYHEVHVLSKAGNVLLEDSSSTGMVSGVIRSGWYYSCRSVPAALPSQPQGPVNVVYAYQLGQPGIPPLISGDVTFVRSIC